MAFVFLFMVAASCIWLLFADPNAILAVSLASAESSLKLCLTLACIYIFWMGVTEIAAASGLIGKLAKKFKPIIRWLFGEQSEEVNNLIATNISANLIGAGGAATPAAIGAISKMNEEPEKMTAAAGRQSEQKKATYPMIMLFILAATSLQILPTTIISILKQHGAAAPENIILPTLLVSALSTVLGIILVRLFVRRK